MSQVALAAAIMALGSIDPVRQLWTTAVLALVVSFCAATQDIGIDAYRMELLEQQQQAAGAAVAVLGYRVGMLASGAGALAVAHWFGWHAAYAVMTGLMAVGVVTVLVSREPAVALAPRSAAPTAAGESLGRARQSLAPGRPLALPRLHAAARLGRDPPVRHPLSLR